MSHIKLRQGLQFDLDKLNIDSSLRKVFWGAPNPFYPVLQELPPCFLSLCLGGREGGLFLFKTFMKVGRKR